MTQPVPYLWPRPREAARRTRASWLLQRVALQIGDAAVGGRACSCEQRENERESACRTVGVVGRGCGGGGDGSERESACRTVGVAGRGCGGGGDVAVGMGAREMCE